MRRGSWNFDMENFVYLDQEYWEASMKAADFQDMSVIGIDWRQSGLCAKRLVGQQGIFRAVPMLAEGEYVHKRNGRMPEQFFCGKLEDFFANIQASPFAMPKETGAERNRTKGLLFLVSVPEARLERYEALDFVAELERAVEPMLWRMCQRVSPADDITEYSADRAGDGFCQIEPDQIRVVLFPRIRVIWEYCRSLDPDGLGIGVVQILEEATQFLLRPGQEVTASFGDYLARSEDGHSREYYHKPVRYRENNYLYEPNRFLWQDASYASWYQAFYQICKKVFEAQRWEEECCRLSIAGSEFSLPCAEKALTDMDVLLSGAGPVRTNDVPSYLLQWFCRLHGLSWDAGPSGVLQGQSGRDVENFRRSEQWDQFRQSGQSGQSGSFGQLTEDIWDI